MTQQTQNPKPSQAALRRRSTEPAWLWFVLIAGSAVIHWVLMTVAAPLLHQRFSPESENVAFVPIDLIELPPQASESAAPIKRESALTAIVPTLNRTLSNQTAPAPSKVAEPPVAISTPQSQLATPAPSTDSSSGLSLPRSSPQVQTSTLSTQPPATDSPVDDSVAGGTAQPARSTERTEAETALGETPQAMAAATPGFATIPIDIPTPDVSETLPASPSPPSPSSPLAQVDVNRENTPVHLTVHLNFERIAAEKAGDNPDRLATPAGGVESRDISTVDESACAGALKPEIMQSLGVKISLQVSTDASGQVTQTAAQSVSHNQSYNELARCLVQHWGFVPAEDAGEPVPSSALLVWVTIDQT